MIDPIAFEIPFVEWPVRWYGLIYALGFLVTWIWLPSLLEKREVKISKDRVGDLVFWIFVGGVLGGEIGGICVLSS